MKKIAVLTSGGDAPGMNAAIRAAVRCALFYGFSVVGIERGYAGLLEGLWREMGMRSVSDIIQRGGTILKTARSEKFPTKEGQKKAAETLKSINAEGLIVIGGDGSFEGARLLSKNCDIPIIGVPATIDNDLPYTDFTIGFDTAVNNALFALNNIRDTMQSHDRVCVLEVMGKDSGDIALFAGLAGGAEIIVIPENPKNPKQIRAEIEENSKRGKTSNIIVLAEGAGCAERLAYELGCKYVVLGHIQRGGAPTMADRILASRLASRAVELLAEKKSGRLTGIRCGQIIDEDIDNALTAEKREHKELYKIAEILGR